MAKRLYRAALRGHRGREIAFKFIIVIFMLSKGAVMTFFLKKRENTPAEHYVKNNIFNNSFSTLEDSRRTTNGDFFYPLDEIFFLTISAVLSGATCWMTIQSFGETKLEWLQRFLPFKKGIPSHEVLEKVFSRLDPVKFGECFANWIDSISPITEGEVIVIDGKTIRGSSDSTAGKSAFHIVSAFASENRVCLGQTTVDTKSNEIIAIPQLLEMLAVKGCVITLDVMGCQKGIAEKIIDKKADYVLMVKDNQTELKAQSEKLFNLKKDCLRDEQMDAGHGRVETRICEVIDDLTFLDGKEELEGLQSIVRISFERYTKKTGKTERQTRYYISSLPANPVKLNHIVRSHWAIDNNLHWSLDMILNEGKQLKKKDNSAVNFNIVSKMALTLLGKEKSRKMSKNNKRLTAALDDKYREKLLNL